MDIVLIEPNMLLAKSYTSQLGASNLKVTIAPDAPTGLQLIDEINPGLVVLEMQLAGHSGVEFLHEFRSYEDWLGIPVIIYSSVPEYAFGLDKTMWHKLGVSRYLNKSKTSVSQLAGIIKTELDHASNSR
jgi:DNA-binding response OmpR family regulator